MPDIFFRLNNDTPDQQRLRTSMDATGRKYATLVRENMFILMDLYDWRLRQLQVTQEDIIDLLRLLANVNLALHEYDISPYIPPNMREVIPVDDRLLVLALLDAARRYADGDLDVAATFPAINYVEVY